jgi:hypothetical protein
MTVPERQGLACMAQLAFVGLLVFEPIMFFEFFPTRFLIGVTYSKIKDIHSLFFYIVSDTNILNISELCKHF